MKKSKSIPMTVMSMIFLLTASQMSAQDSRVAILLNLVNTKLKYDGANASLGGYEKSVRGLQAGLSWQAGVTKHFSIVTELYFERKGGGLEINNPLHTTESTLKLNTIEIPLLARLHAGKFYFNAGPYATYVFSGKISSTGESLHSISFRQEGIRRWEAGIQAGLGYQFKLKKTKMAADFRYAYGTNSLSTMDDLKTRTINISVLAYLFGKSKQ